VGFLGLGSLIGGIGSLFGGLLGSSASEEAAQQYEQALQQGMNFLQNEQQTGIAGTAPFLAGGQQGATTLAGLMSTPGAGLLTPWTQQFTPLSGAQVQQTPGYQFQLQQGENAIQNSAAGQGSLLTGRTLGALNNFAQGTANQAYQQYGVEDPLLQYQSAYQSFLNNQQNTYNMLSGLSNQGLQAAGMQNNLLTGLGGDIASMMGQKGAAAAGGTIGSANAWSNAIGGLSNNFGSMGMLQGLMGMQMLGGLMNNMPDAEAEGTDFAPGGPTLVGERGPELVNLPTGSQVVPNKNLPIAPIAQPVSLGGLMGGMPGRGMPVAPIARPVMPGGGGMPPRNPVSGPVAPIAPWMMGNPMARMPLSALA